MSPAAAAISYPSGHTGIHVVTHVEEARDYVHYIVPFDPLGDIVRPLLVEPQPKEIFDLPFHPATLAIHADLRPRLGSICTHSCEVNWLP